MARCLLYLKMVQYLLVRQNHVNVIWICNLKTYFIKNTLNMNIKPIWHFKNYFLIYRTFNDLDQTNGDLIIFKRVKLIFEKEAV